MIRYLLCTAAVSKKREPFEAIAKERLRKILKERPPREDLSVVIMDVDKGTRKTVEVRVRNGTPVQTEKMEEPRPFEPVTSKSYGLVDAYVNGQVVRREQFKAGQPKVMSITNVYNEIFSIGSEDPGSLQEVSIFSHGYYNGPILVGSYDTYSEMAQSDPTFTKGEYRDPDDKDGRMKDFNDTNLPHPKPDLFRSAFAPSGYFWVWGCNGNKGLDNLLRKIERSGGGSPGKDPIKLTQLTADQIAYLTLYADVFAIDPELLRKRQRCEITPTALRTFLLSLLKHCYVYELTAATKVRAFGAAPGTTSIWPDSKNMAIEPFQRPTAAMYKRWLGLNLDPENRSYAEFTPKLATLL